MVSRRLRKVDKGWGGRGGIDAVQCLVQVANVCKQGAADHARRFSCACFLRFLMRGLRDVIFMDGVLMERLNDVHLVLVVSLKCKTIDRHQWLIDG